MCTVSTPLHLGLLPSSLRVLHIHGAQPLVCAPPSALSSLRLFGVACVSPRGGGFEDSFDIAAGVAPKTTEANTADGGAYQSIRPSREATLTTLASTQSSLPLHPRAVRAHRCFPRLFFSSSGPVHTQRRRYREFNSDTKYF
jgi:hypothetical protein